MTRFTSPTHPTAARRLEERGRALFTFWWAGGTVRGGCSAAVA